MFGIESCRTLRKNQNLYIVVKNNTNSNKSMLAEIGDLILLNSNYHTLPSQIECKNINNQLSGLLLSEQILEFQRNALNDRKIQSLLEYKTNNHFYGTFNPTKPIYCYHCCDFIWGYSNRVSVCFCNLLIYLYLL